ncbi:DUF4365 domain-containing protein [Flavobacterium suzhouense]|uniref:DUF4365 domain-containing protein n=1 Tax=Flavobacterium suzhouense TaxID=1529638 RepID=A0ABW5NV02_9FLAO
MSKKIIKAKPAAYPLTNTPEVEAVRMLEYIIDKERLKTSLSVLDKVPNIDGHIEVVTEHQHPIGKLEVQVKYLPKKSYGKPRYQCDLQFLSYCENSIMPVLLIVVNTQDEKAYWIHLSRNFLHDITGKIRGKTVSVGIPMENVISRAQDSYLASWISIIEDYKTRLINYDGVKSELERITTVHAAMKKLSNPAIGLDKSEFKEIHLFLDYYNHFLDHDFSIIKEVFYKEYWKIGVAYSRYEERGLSYSLYPISYSTNDVQIKHIANDEVRSLKNILNRVSNHTTNPIKYKPKELAYEYIISDLKKVVDNEMLLPINEFIAVEYIISFLDRFDEVTGFNPGQKSYQLQEIRYLLDTYLPLFIEQYLENDDPHEEITFELDHFRWHVFEEEIVQVHEKLKERLASGSAKVTLTNLKITSSSFNMEYLCNLIQHLENSGFRAITRHYPIRKYPQLESYFTWQVYNDSDVKQATETIFNNLPPIYDRFVTEYFPNLASELSFYSFFDRLVVNIEPLDPDNIRGGYGIQMIYLKTLDGERKNRADVYMLGKDVPVVSFEIFRREKNVSIDGHRYEIVSSSSSHLDNIFRDLPMLDYLYDTLKNRLENYLKPFHKSSYIFKFTKI